MCHSRSQVGDVTSRIEKRSVGMHKLYCMITTPKRASGVPEGNVQTEIFTTLRISSGEFLLMASAVRLSVLAFAVVAAEGIEVSFVDRHVVGRRVSE